MTAVLGVVCAMCGKRYRVIVLGEPRPDRAYFCTSCEMWMGVLDDRDEKESEECPA